MAPDDHIPKLYDEVGELKESMASVKTELHGVNVTLLAIRDGLREAGKTPWPIILGTASLSVTLVLAGVAGIFNFIDRDVTRLARDQERAAKAMMKDVERHESELDKRAYLTEAFGVYREEQRDLERRIDKQEAESAYIRGFRDGQRDQG
jgi:hypothetical protein